MRKTVATLLALTILSTGAAFAMSERAEEPAVSEEWAGEPFVTLKHPEWSRDAVLYQINTRQFTPEGTFAAAQEELPRL